MENSDYMLLPGNFVCYLCDIANNPKRKTIKLLLFCRGGLELIELKKGQTVKTFIPKVAEGVFTIICLFNKTDEYVLYYHSGKKTLRVFR